MNKADRKSGDRIAWRLLTTKRSIIGTAARSCRLNGSCERSERERCRPWDGSSLTPLSRSYVESDDRGEPGRVNSMCPHDAFRQQIPPVILSLGMAGRRMASACSSCAKTPPFTDQETSLHHHNPCT